MFRSLFVVIFASVLFVTANGISLTVTYYSDSRCLSETNTITYDMGNCDPSTGACDQSCYKWNGKDLNSANDFKCTTTGITYNQYVQTGTCSGSPHTKVADIGKCVEEPSGRMYSQITQSDGAVLANCPAGSDLVEEEPNQNVKVTVTYYGDSSCRQERNTITYDMGSCDATTGVCDQSCYKWDGKDLNSANDFTCTSEGITYKQYVKTGTCSGGSPHDKVAEVGKCVEEPSGQMYSMITSSDATVLQKNCPSA